MLNLSGVTRRYGDTVALEDLNLIVPEDTYMSLLGASGSGKTTLLRLIAGFEEPDAGQLWLDGERLDGKAPHKRDIGFVFQNFALFPHLSVQENVEFGLKHRETGACTDPKELADRAAKALQLVGLDGFGHRGVGEISGGQKQRVALARTLVTEPRIVLLDEPLGALDANLRNRMCDELRAIRERLKVSFLHVTGSETEALTMGDTVAVLSDGKIAHGHDHDHKHHHGHHHHDETLGVVTFSLTVEQPLDWTDFGIWLTLLLHRHGDRIFRVKGILALAGEARPVAIHGVQHLVHAPVHMEHWPDGPRHSRLVFILEGLDPALIRRSFHAFIRLNDTRGAQAAKGEEAA